MSRTNTFKRTRAPPSLQTLATDSNAQPLRPSTPAVAQAARWWPRASNGRPYRQLRTERGRGNRSLRRSNTRKGAESILDNRLVGKETNALLANGPHCDLIMALSWSCNTGQTAVEGALWLRVPTGSAHWLEGSLIPCTSSRRMGCKRSSSWGSSKPRS